MSKACDICSGIKPLSSYSIELVDEDGEHYTKTICGTCWDIIAAVATKALEQRITALEQVHVLTHPRECAP